MALHILGPSGMQVQSVVVSFSGKRNALHILGLRGMQVHIGGGGPSQANALHIFGTFGYAGAYWWVSWLVKRRDPSDFHKFFYRGVGSLPITHGQNLPSFFHPPYYNFVVTKFKILAMYNGYEAKLFNFQRVMFHSLCHDKVVWKRFWGVCSYIVVGVTPHYERQR
jgi:hypothetical protein